jgi:fumarylpyruvate hydrolase
VAPRPTVAIAGGTTTFPVRRIFCVGRNYAEHSREMGATDLKAPPFFFTKPAEAVVASGSVVPFPGRTTDLHHEIELVVALASAREIFGYAAGIDLTRRDIQAIAKKQGRPWEMAKGFDHSAPIGDIAPVTRIGHPGPAAITLAINGTTRQSSSTGDMIWPLPAIIAELSRFVALKAGDLIFTGTPAGVGAIVRGDRLEGSVAGVGTVGTTIV